MTTVCGKAGRFYPVDAESAGFLAAGPDTRDFWRSTLAARCAEHAPTGIGPVPPIFENPAECDYSADEATGSSCGHGHPPCGDFPTRIYMVGHRCAVHTPARLRGLPEPDIARYCAPGPGRCYCGKCPNWTPVTMSEPGATITDIRAVASGRRRSNMTAFRDAQRAKDASQTKGGR